MPVIRRQSPPIATGIEADADRKSPFASVAEAAEYLKESKRTVRELVARGVFKLAPNSNGKTKPWRLLWEQIEKHGAEQTRRAA